VEHNAVQQQLDRATTKMITIIMYLLFQIDKILYFPGFEKIGLIYYFLETKQAKP
jgi:hypothetical protein